MRRIVTAVLALVVLVALVKGLHPMTKARTADDSRHKAKDTAESVLSAIHQPLVIPWHAIVDRSDDRVVVDPSLVPPEPR